MGLATSESHLTRNSVIIKKHLDCQVLIMIVVDGKDFGATIRGQSIFDDGIHQFWK
jgi:hypothetical protein